MLPGKDPTVILHPVPVEEPDGYRGRRRRFFMTRKGGGVALPALLVAASIVVVLIVIGVAQLLPRDTTGQIPAGGGNGAVTGDGGGAGAPDPGGQPGSSAGASASGRPSKSGSPAARPGPSPSGGVAPVPVAPGGPPPAPTTSAPPRRQAVAVEAESAGVGGGAAPASCSTCSGGTKVRWIGNGRGYVTVTVNGVASAGNYPMTITYELGEASRTYYIQVNGGSPRQVTLTSNVTDWNTPLNVTVQIALSAGTNTIKFYNPTGNAPDLDRVTV
jgi:hypothetical protein